MRRLALILILLFSIALPAAAQAGGQFCVRSFEDRNGNGTLDSGEPLLTRGISADLVNADSVIVASALLADSPTAAQGVICFQFLTPGDYTIVVASATYNPTTTNTFSASISEGTLPTVVTYGGQRISAAPAATPTGAGDLSAQLGADFLPRVVISLLGALLVMAGMIVLGTLVYLLFFRGRQPYPAYDGPQTGSTSNTLPPVELDDDIPPDTDEIEPVT